jgi:hydroxymethylpyrimidine/phosphomethylpyrimidine kinase
MDKIKGTEILGNLVEAIDMLQNCREFAALMPEVRVNLVYALPKAGTPEEVAAIEGRMTVVQGLPHAAGIPKWGASDHMARLIIEIRKYDPTINAGINFKYDEVISQTVREYCAEQGIRFGWIDRTKEPIEAAEQDGASMPWKMKQLVESSGGVPKLFYEGEGWGKEPLFVALGNDTIEVASIAIDISRRLSKKLSLNSKR